MFSFLKILFLLFTFSIWIRRSSLWLFSYLISQIPYLTNFLIDYWIRKSSSSICSRADIWCWWKEVEARSGFPGVKGHCSNCRFKVCYITFFLIIYGSPNNKKKNHEGFIRALLNQGTNNPTSTSSRDHRDDPYSKFNTWWCVRWKWNAKR